MSFKKKLLILWGIVAVSYAVLWVLTNPVIMIPHDRQQAMVDTYQAYVEEMGCWPPPEMLVAEEFRVPFRTVRVVVRHAHEQGWERDPCAPYR